MRTSITEEDDQGSSDSMTGQAKNWTPGNGKLTKANFCKTLTPLKESDGDIRTSLKRAFGFRFKNINHIDNVADIDICEVTAAA